MSLISTIKRAYPAAPNMAAGGDTAATLVFDDSVDKESRLSIKNTLESMGIYLPEDRSADLKVGIKKLNADLLLFRIVRDEWQPIAAFCDEAIEGISVIIYKMSCNGDDAVINRIQGLRLSVRCLSYQQQYAALQMLRAIKLQDEDEVLQKALEKAVNQLFKRIDKLSATAPCLSLLPISEETFEDFRKSYPEIEKKHQLVEKLYGKNWSARMEQAIADYCEFISSRVFYARELSAAEEELRSQLSALRYNSYDTFLRELPLRLNKKLAVKSSEDSWSESYCNKLRKKSASIRQQLEDADELYRKIARSKLGKDFVSSLLSKLQPGVDNVNGDRQRVIHSLNRLRHELDSFCIFPDNRDIPDINLGCGQLLDAEKDDTGSRVRELLGTPASGWDAQALHDAQLSFRGIAWWLCSSSLREALVQMGSMFVTKTYSLPINDNGFVWLIKEEGTMDETEG